LSGYRKANKRVEKKIVVSIFTAPTTTYCAVNEQALTNDTLSPSGFDETKPLMWLHIAKDSFVGASA
jgi:hypothetical protein